MTVSGRIVAGYAVLVFLMTLGLGYELIVLERVQASNERLSATAYAGLEITELGELFRLLEDVTARYLSIDEDYAEQLADVHRLFGETMARGGDVLTSDEAREALGQVEASFDEFGRLLESTVAARRPGTYERVPPRIESELRRLDTRIDRVGEEVRDTLEQEVRRAGTERQRAWGVAWAVAVAAVALAGGVALSTSRSIRGSFARFTAATTSVAGGDFAGRLPEHTPDEFGNLAKSFNRMAMRLDELDRLKKDFVSSVSHELKSPIASARETVQLVLDEVPGPLNAEQRRLLELSIRSSRRLSTLVGGLLDLARLDAGSLTYQIAPHDLGELTASVLEEVAVTARDRGLEIEATLDTVPSIDCDGDRIVQVVGNLLDNAMKFSRRGSRIVVRLEALADGTDPRVPKGIMLSVLDQGPGVRDTDKKRIFARFQQVRPEGSPQQGVGLGLAISRSIVEDHGGRIWVDDNPRGGAVFRFVLPSEPVGRKPAPSPDRMRV